MTDMLPVPLEERLAILELSGLYAFYCDTRRYEQLSRLFAEDCFYDESCVGLTPVTSRAAFLQQFMTVRERLGPMMHTCSNRMITAFSGHRASEICYVLAEGILNFDAAKQPFRIFGYYDDDYTKDEDGGWYFKSRVLRLLVPSQGAETTGGIAYDAMRNLPR